MLSLRDRTALLSVLAALSACQEATTTSGDRATPGAISERPCLLDTTIEDSDDELRYLPSIECQTDFDALASLPIDVTIPGVRSAKFVIDRFDTSEGNLGRLYFQNSTLYPIHYDFVSANIKRTFDATNFTRNYYGADDTREFYLGSISHYEEHGLFALELAAYDTATTDMVERMFDVLSEERAYFAPALSFHPMSEPQLAVAAALPARIPVVTTEDIFAKTDYQPLTRATAMGVVTFMTAAQIAAGEFVPYYSIVVLDQAPNDISVVSGIITDEFQSVLSHVNVLSTNRGTPNMGLRGALSNPVLREHEGKWVELTVAADRWEMRPVSAEEGMAFYEAHKPEPPILPPMDFSARELKDAASIVPDYLTLNRDPLSRREDVRAAILNAVYAYGGKTANYAILAQLPELPVPRAFGIPVYYYDKFMRDNGFYDWVAALLDDRDPESGEPLAFNEDPEIRQEALRDLRNAMMEGELDPELLSMLREKLNREYLGPDGVPTKMRFRTSTNSEDLDGFPCAGCYESHTGDPANWQSVLDAIRLTYTSTWLFRTFEERSYYGVEHMTVGMALLVHGHFPNETANGVAITANPYDLTQANADAYYVNVAYGGDAEVVHLPEGVTTDQFLYYVGASGSNAVYISRSNQELPSDRDHVLSEAEVGELVLSLTTIKDTFKKAYTLDSGWYAMDVEFKFAPQDAWGIQNRTPTLWIKQARPYPDPTR